MPDILFNHFCGHFVFHTRSLALGLKNFTLIAIFFTFVWFIYAVGLLLSTFVVKPGLRIKVIQRKNPTIVRYELRDSSQKGKFNV